MPSSPSESVVNRDLLGGLSFVVLWSTGYISASFALEGAGSYTLAVVRFLGTVILIGAWLLAKRAPRPTSRALMHAAIGGVLLQGGFFGFAYAGMNAGVPPAAAGLIAGLMPLTTALGGALLLGERMTRSAALGLLLGLVGVLFVMIPDLRATGSVIGYVFMFLALASLSLGTLYQKRNGGNMDARLALVTQVGAAMIALLPLAWWIDGLEINPTAGTLGGMAWPSW